MRNVQYATRWFYRHFAHEEVTEGEDACCVCGLPTDGGRDVNKVLRPTFTNQDILPRPDSSTVCPACAWYFDHQELLRQHWYLTPVEARSLAKADILPLLQTHLETPPPVDGYYLIAQSKKKHIALRGRLNTAGARSLRVNCEELLVDVDGAFMTLLSNVVTLRNYHRWDEIEGDKYLPWAILRWPGIADFERTRAAVRPWLRSPQYQLARYLYSPQQKAEPEQKQKEVQLGLPA